MADRRRWQGRSIVIVVAAVLVMVGGVGVWVATRRTADAATSTTSTVAASVQTLKQTVSATGAIAPKTRADLGFASAGTVTAVNVAVGDQVTAGQVLASIDPTELRGALTVAQANLDSANAQLTSALASGTAAQASAARAQVASTTSKRDSAQQGLGAATMTSPIAGTVATVNLAPGARVTASAGGSGGGTSAAGAGGSGAGGSGGSNSSGAQIVVITTNAWVVDASVSSADLAQVKKGLQAQVTPTGERQPVFGTVSSVGVIASTSAGTASFPVTVDVTGTPAGLYAGGSADVSIVVRQITDAVTVPTAAIRTENGQTVVHQVKNGATVSTPVILGLIAGTMTQVTSGLSVGDAVVVESRGFTGGGQGGSTSTGTRTRGTGSGGTNPGGGGQGRGGGSGSVRNGAGVGAGQ